jgi:hypothetical protein
MPVILSAPERGGQKVGEITLSRNEDKGFSGY